MYWRARLVGDVHETVLGAAGNADHIASLRIEATTVHSVEVSAFEDTKNLRLGMLVSRRAFAGRVDGFDDGERAALAAGAMRTMRSSPLAGIVIGASAPLE